MTINHKIMIKAILILFSILTFFIMRAQGKYLTTFTIVAHTTGNNFYPEPNCLTAKDGTFVELLWVENGNNTITTNAGSFGDYNCNQSFILNIFKERERTNDTSITTPQLLKFNNNTKFNYELYYKCDLERKAPYNLLGGPAGAIAFLIKSLKDEVQISINELEKSEESFREKKKSESSCNLISASKEILVGAYSSETEYLQNTEVTEKTCSNELHPCPISTSNFLPETASQLLRYYGKVYNLLLLTHYGRHLESSIQRMA
ncbi:hypothetical protein RhiirC2_864683 [Rhizophagus irregularis]|uniref:Uncharacterized protein n=1 Tax=Rhizophagus irregularis TaxID=588596 RepID=A0A2N1NGH1_9GLOM|nr:hypothetical protein RhiirC2_864683 [Rhizophagus irregularis]